MRVEDRVSTDRVQQARERFVPRGVADDRPRRHPRLGRPHLGRRRAASTSTSPAASPARTSATATAAVVRAIHEQVDRYLHQCFMVGIYEPYVAVCREARRALARRRRATRRSILLNSGAEAIENAVKIARAATGRAGVVVFDRAFHGRTNLTMAMTSKLVYKQGFGPLATGRPPRARAVPVPRRHDRGRARTASSCSSSRTSTRSEVACIVLEPVQGEGGFIPMPPEFVHALRELCDEHGILYVDDEVQSGCGRTGHDLGDRALRRRARPARLRQDARRRPAARGRHGPRRADGRARTRAASAARSAATRSPAPPRSPCSTSSPRRASASAPSRSRRSSARGSTRSPRGSRLVGEVRGLGAMLALELARAERRRREGRDDRGARREGLVLLSCGLYGNVIRLLPPLVGDGRGARARARDPGGGAWRRRLRLALRRRAGDAPRCG